MRLSFVLVHYHTPELLDGAIEAIRTGLRTDGLEGDILVVDNGSSAAERALLEELPVDKLDAGGNRGYAGAINLGVRHTTGEIVVVMNPDVIVLRGCIAALVRSLEGGAAAAGPRSYWDRLHPNGGDQPEPADRGTPSHRRPGPRPSRPAQRVQKKAESL